MRTQLIVILFLFHSNVIAKSPVFTFLEAGNTPLYEYNGLRSQDLSGAAIDDHSNIVLGYDGGRNSSYPEVKLVKDFEVEEPASMISRKIIQKDIEGMTYHNGQFLVISSLSQANEDTEDYRILSAINIDPLNGQVISGNYIYLRMKLLAALRDHFNSKDWFARASSSFGKAGGLNVEGISKTEDKDKVLIGLRSPLWSKNFGSPVFGKAISLTQGDAILLELTHPFTSKPQFNVKTINLNGKGVRGIEYISELDAYIIISGPVEKSGLAVTDNEYELWLYQDKQNKVTKINIPEFNQLCRPEAVLPIEQDNSIFIFSENSGSACQDRKFSYIKISYEN